MKKIALVGKPNSGKSSLFNFITGLNQKIGNYSGVTVEKKSGKYLGHSIVDLPGMRSIHAVSPEEKISKQAILGMLHTQSPIVYVANGMQLEDSLVMFSEIADLQIPMALVINFKDDLAKHKINIDTVSLENQLGCPVVLTNARSGEGLADLESIVSKDAFKVPNAICRSLFDQFSDHGISNNYVQHLEVEPNDTDFERIEFQKRQKIIASIIGRSTDKQDVKAYLERSKKWDKYLLHPIYGLIIFLAVMFVVFQAVFSFASYPMDWIDAGMSQLSAWAGELIPAGWLQSFVSDALIQGIGGVVIFIPQIAILFFLLGVLEHTGYLSRISFISDAFLRKFGLSGKSVIPLMSSWACSIPAIMSTRVIDDPRERMAVIMASPLMTCSARLPVYTILIAVIFPQNDAYFFGVQGLALLSLYLLGVVATLGVAWLVNKRTSAPSNPFWSLELPVYRFPNWRNILINVYQKTKSFVVEAGKVILAISIILWVLSTNGPKDEAFLKNELTKLEQTDQTGEVSMASVSLEYSYLGYLGKVIEPTIRPLGYDWKIGIALLSSFAAREVFVGTLSTIYSIGSEEESTILERLKREKNKETGLARFNFATAISLLLFYVFAMQCMSTLAIVRKETGQWEYAIYQFLFMLVLAYGFAFLAYQLLS